MQDSHPDGVSVIIPAYNAEQTVEKTIRAVLAQDYGGKIEIVVVDDGSTDRTAQIIKSFQQVHYVFQKNAGPASARNRGAREASFSYLAFTDSDCVPSKEWIGKLMNCFPPDPKIAVISGTYGLMNAESMLAFCIQNEITYRHQQLMPEFPKFFGSYNFCIRKSIFDKVKGFNEGYLNASGEDNDLSYKIVKAGYKICFQKNVIVKHFHPAQLPQYLKEQFRHGYWRVKMYTEHIHMARGDDYTFPKDIIEFPLVITISLSLVMGVFKPVFLKLAALFLILFFLFELFFSALMQKNFKSSFYFATVMSLRAFYRTAGFLTGTSHFLLGKGFKKIK